MTIVSIFTVTVYSDLAMIRYFAISIIVYILSNWNGKKKIPYLFFKLVLSINESTI